MLRFALAPSFLLLEGALFAQAVLNVGPGGFAQIQTAINAAANGDVIVIQTGTYQPFTLTKDLTLTAAPGAAVEVLSPVSPFAGPTIVQPNSLATLTGLRFRAPVLAIVPSDVRVLGGTVHFADCVFESSRTTLIAPPGLLVQDANVALQRCLVFGGGIDGTVLPGSGAGSDGLAAVHAKVAAVDCAFFGGNLGWDWTGHGGHGVLVDDSDVHLANCLAVGGSNDGINPGWPPGDGVHIATPSHVWLADCDLHGGVGHGHVGGAGLANTGGGAANEARSTFVGGPGVPAGPAVIGPLATSALLGFIGTTPPVVLGTTWTIVHRTAPGTPVLALWSGALAPAVLPLVDEPAWLPASAFAAAGAGVTDASGQLVFTFAVPANPTLLHAPVFVQSFAGAVLPLAASPPVGGVIR